MYKSKLRQKRGAALMYSLLFFLFCALVSTLVVTAAAANAGKAAKVREEQQEYLSVRSAARLVVDMMSAGSFQGYYTVDDELIVKTETEGDTTITVIDHIYTFLGPVGYGERDKESGYYFENITCIPPEMIKKIGNFYLSTVTHEGNSLVDQFRIPVDSGPLRATFVVTVKEDEDEDEGGGGEIMPPVTVTLEIHKADNGSLPQYSATITAVSASGNYKLVVDGKADVKVVESKTDPRTEITRTKVVTKVTWSANGWTARKG